MISAVLLATVKVKKNKSFFKKKHVLTQMCSTALQRSCSTVTPYCCVVCIANWQVRALPVILITDIRIIGVWGWYLLPLLESPTGSLNIQPSLLIARKE